MKRIVFDWDFEALIFQFLPFVALCFPEEDNWNVQVGWFCWTVMVGVVRDEEN